MDCLNLHCHEIQIYSYDWKESNFNKKISIPYNKKVKISVKENDYLYAIKCSNCMEYNNDFSSNFNYQNSSVSLFCNKNSKKDLESSNKIKCYEFIECCDIFLIGAKNEIIQYICQKNNKLNENLNAKENKIKELNSDKDANEKSIKKLRNIIEVTL